ncbi:MAG: poly-gamma-glutamate biosynthesis protein PgsC [Gammaproteobacteria bacterium]
MIIEPLTLSIGIGLIIGLLFAEFFGLYAGGMVVPGYVALDLYHPGTVALTLVDAIVIFIIVRAMSRYLIVYGRRRIALFMLLAFILGEFFRQMFSSYFVVEQIGNIYTIIGYIIPGLIAISIDRQGVVETFSTLLTASVIVRLLMIILIGQALLV